MGHHSVGGIAEREFIRRVGPKHALNAHKLLSGADRSWSFHTYSMFDTTLEIAACDVWLATPAQASHWEQHISGVKWLTARVEANDLSWLRMDMPLPPRRTGHFQALVTMDGMLSEDQLPRERPVPTQSPSNPENPRVIDIAVAAN